jgi:hypothetical protein
MWRIWSPYAQACENVKWCSHCGKQFGGPSKTKVELSYGPAILLLGTSQKELQARS